MDYISVFSKWLQKQVVYRMDDEEVKERTKKKTEGNIESKKHRREKGAAHIVTGEPTPKCVVCHGPHQVTNARTGVKYLLRIDGKLPKRMNFVIVA